MLKNHFWLHSGSSPGVFSSLRGLDSEHTHIEYGLVRTSLGNCLAAFSDVGLCWFEPDPADDIEQSLRGHWSPATMARSDDHVHARLEEMLVRDFLQLHLCGTEFQLLTWTALLDTAVGKTQTYGELARRLGMPRSARAVGSALGANHLALFVPCHRVVPAAGGVGNYRWGSALKRWTLAQEASQTSASVFRPPAVASAVADYRPA
jgi:AraC family transcriptional regulator of adaptative response/methylated-DNA-[protein]-cysteine methyltransferase